jgi:hypothetical protein
MAAALEDSDENQQRASRKRIEGSSALGPPRRGRGSKEADDEDGCRKGDLHQRLAGGYSTMRNSLSQGRCHLDEEEGHLGGRGCPKSGMARSCSEPDAEVEEAGYCRWHLR